MEKDDFRKRIEQLKKPEIGELEHMKILKLTLLNARKSAVLGIWLVIIPCYFLFCVVMLHYFNINLRLFEAMEDLIAGFDHTPGLKFLGPLLLVGLPIVAFIINALAIMHFYFDKSAYEINITIKIKWLNLIIMFASLCIVCILLLYVITENVHHS